MRFVGIDPGLAAGALAAVDGQGQLVEVLAMPVVKVGKTGNRSRYDLQEIKAFLTRQLIESGGSLFVTIEKQGAMPASMGGAWTNYARGQSIAFETACVFLGIPHQLVAPQSWQAKMHKGTPEGDRGQRSIVKAKQLWPTTSLRRTERARKDDDGLAEALLIADFGRQERNGIEEEDDDVSDTDGQPAL